MSTAVRSWVDQSAAGGSASRRALGIDLRCSLLVPSTMRNFPCLTASLLAAAMLAGCGSSSTQTPPARPLMATFTAASAGDAKTQLMAACSKKGLRIQSTEFSVTCTRTTDDYYRDLLLNRVINDEYALDIREVIVFDLMPRGNDIRVIGRTYAQFSQPVSITASNEIRRRDLVDDETYKMMQNLLQMTKAVE